MAPLEVPENEAFIVQGDYGDRLYVTAGRCCFMVTGQTAALNMW